MSWLMGGARRRGCHRNPEIPTMTQDCSVGYMTHDT